jgi:DNA polymerase-3 subunit epsilon
MNDFLLFLDTEASGLPKKWDVPYSVPGNWPYCVQVAWIIYKANGEELKTENYYINDNDFNIEPSAIKVHGITREFLNSNGKSRKEVMTCLANDILNLNPLIVGHFMQFDAHMVGADFYRTGIGNPVTKTNSFCTMIASKALVRNPAAAFLRLGELYDVLFDLKMSNQHNAIEDARATAACFFELRTRGEITSESIALQQKEEQNKAEGKKDGCSIPFLFIVSIVILIFYFL